VAVRAAVGVGTVTFLQQARLRPVPGRVARLEDAAGHLVDEMRRSGLVWGAPMMTWADGVLDVLVRTPCEDALRVDCGDAEVAGALAALRTESVAGISWRARGGPGPGQRPAAERAACSEFVLQTDALDDSSPVRAGDDGGPVPLYLLVPDPKLRRALVAWRSAFRDHDRIWLGSGPLEEAACLQLADCDSELNRGGRALVAELERAIGRPVYHFLHRHHAQVEAESTRPCPSCGRSWARVADCGSRGLDRFEFRCEPCRLVSFRGLPDPNG
jgi:predicted  nucleic acid-binding Zn ribbon protein